MFTGCGVDSGNNQYVVRDPVVSHPGLEGNKAIQTKNGMNPGNCSVYHSQLYCNAGQPAGANNISNPLKLFPVPPHALKLGQNGFKKVCRTEEGNPCPFPGLESGVLEMRVKEGSKIRNLMGFAMARIQGEKGASGDGLRQVVFTGSGRAVTKTITCAEIMKRKVGVLHQLTKLQYKVVKEVWESTEGTATQMTVHKTVPSISILLSKDPLDPQEPGYQPPECLGALWEEKERAEPSSQGAAKRPLEPLLYSSLHHCKRTCLGEGVSMQPPSSLTGWTSVKQQRTESEEFILVLPCTQAQHRDNQNTHSNRTPLSQKNWESIPASRGQPDWNPKASNCMLSIERTFSSECKNIDYHIHKTAVMRATEF